jgi:hypothetical protein
MMPRFFETRVTHFYPLDCGEDRRFRAGIGVRPAPKAAILAALQSHHPASPFILENG